MPTRSEVIRARRRAVGGRRPRCRRGKSCSAACINQNKHCLVDAPTPVEGALPRAVKAIQTRKEKLGRKEQRQVAQRRREYVKGKVVESARLREERTRYIKERNSLIVQLRRAMYSTQGYRDVKTLREKLEALEEEVGSRLKVPKSEPIKLSDVLRGFSRAQTSYRDRMYGLHRKMEMAAGSDASVKRDKNLYEQLEKRFMKLADGRGSAIMDRGVSQGEFKRFISDYKKGDTWDHIGRKRQEERSSKLNRVFRSLIEEAGQAAKDGDREKYKLAESKFLKIRERAKDRIDLPEHQIPKKGSLWIDTRVSKTLVNLRDLMQDALTSGDLKAYNKAEARLIKIRDRYLREDEGSRRRDRLYVAGGSPRLLVDKGQALADFQRNLERRMRNEAYLKNRGAYNKLEQIYVKLNPQEKAGRIWKERLKEVAEEHVVALRRKMERAASAGNRKEYSKLEKVLLRLDPEEKKGKMWREGRIRAYLPTLKDQLQKAASEGDRAKYNKLEKVLFKIDPNNPNNVKGKIWAKEKINVVVDKLRLDIDKAIRDNDRASYDRLEARLFRIRDKVGPLINDYDLRYARKGELWNEVKDKTKIADLESSLNKERREGVDKISIRGDSSDFEVISRVLGNKLAVHFSPNDSTSFTVNDSYTATDNLTKKEKIAIIREVKRQYNEVMGTMEDNTVFKVIAASGDGREDMRTGAYTGYGFSDPDYNGYMYGVVRKGKVEPIDEDEYYDLQ